MKLLSILFSLFIGLAMSQTTWAYKEADLQKLLETKSCPGCDLKTAPLSEINLREANLRGADLSGAKLRKADLGSADLNGADLTGADLTGAILRKADLESADLNGADLTGANLTSANLRAAHVIGANFSTAILVNVTIAYLEHDSTTIWPKGFERPKEKASTAKVWCFTNWPYEAKYVNYVSKLQCASRAGKPFSNYNLAVSYCENIKNSCRATSSTTASASSSTASSSSSSESTVSSDIEYCFDPDIDLYYPINRSFCHAGDVKISKQEFDNKRLTENVANSIASSKSKRYCYRLDPELFYVASIGVCSESEKEVSITKKEFDSRDLSPSREYLLLLRGHNYFKGEGVEKNYDLALKWFKKVEEFGENSATGWIGYLYEQGGYGLSADLIKALQSYRKCGDWGDPWCEVSLGWFYVTGRGGVRQSYAEAARWFDKSATQGQAYAQYALGNLYEKGQGVEQDIDEAKRLYQLSANQAYKPAETALLRLASLSSVASSSSKISYCFDRDIGLYYSIDREFCDAGDLKITKQEYDDKPLIENVANSALVAVTVGSNISGSQIHIDGENKGITHGNPSKLNVLVSKGQHTIRVSKSGYDDYVAKINVTSDRHVASWLKKKTSSSTTASSSQKLIEKRILTISTKAYQGLIIYSDREYENLPTTVEFFVDDSKLFGNYSIVYPEGKEYLTTKGEEVYSGGEETGTLRLVEVQESTGEFLFEWIDSYGKGLARFTFDPSLASFTGTWGAGNSDDDGGEWTGSWVEKDLTIVLGPQEATPKSTQTADTSLELEFWQSIKNRDDPEMFRAYLTEFPEGKFVLLAQINLKKLGRTASTVPSAIPDLNYGRYYALVIGNNDYQDFPDLQTAINDAQAVALLLENEYDFEVNLLKNATRSDIVDTLAGLRRIVGSQDNLLIYFAGHGILDEGINKAYWLPVDADRDSPSNWIPSDTVAAQIGGMDAKHVLVVADSCFSGALMRGFVVIQQEGDDYLQELVKKKSRTALTSGGLEPVMDSGGSGHSVFARALLNLLEENTAVLDTAELFSQLRPKVMSNSDQTPEYGYIHKTGHDGGDFLFVRR